MKKLVVTVSGVAAAIGFSMPVCPSAQAEPFIPCPYDPAVPGAQTQYFNQKTSQLVAEQHDVNTRILGPLSNPERDAWAKSPAGQAELARETQIVNERDHPPQSCNPLQPVSGAPYFDPGPLQQPNHPGAPKTDDTGTLKQPADHSCADLNDAWKKTGALPDGADVLLLIKKLPGFGDVKAGQLIGCGIGQTIAGSPGDSNIGMCNGVAALDPVPFAPNPCPALGAG